MQRIGDRLVFSPSDLNHFLECEHLIQLERRRDPSTPRSPRDAHAELLAEKGAEHERAWLERFRAEGRAIVEVAASGRDRDWPADAGRGDFDAYYRSVRARFLASAVADQPTYPYPVAHCALCEHAAACEEQWFEADHVSNVAHIRREQVHRLNDAGIRTVEDLASVDVTTRLGIGAVTLERLRHQAALQTGHRRTGAHRYDLLPVDERSGFRLLPAPSPGDVFFDMEGDPYFSPARGLEYLFGVMTVDAGAPAFRAFQALDRVQEKAAFEAFIDFVSGRLARWPDLHVYHYAAYEPSALKRLMAEHATREDELDDLLRREVFVDLYQVVRQSMRISHASYSIKKVRTFFMEGAGQGAVTEGGDSILEFERWRRTGDPAILQAIVDYNEEDCLSTVKLRDWLLERRLEAERQSGADIPYKIVESVEESEQRAELDAITARRRVQLLALGTADATLLADLLNYHRRESKPEWWAYFDRHKKSLDDLIDDTEAIAYLRPVDGLEPERVKQSLVYTLEFPDQEFKLAPKDQVEDPFRQERAGTIEWIDSSGRRLGLKRGIKRGDEPLPTAVVVGKPLDNTVQRDAIGRVADAWVSGHADYAAVRRLLALEHPRIRNRAVGAVIQATDLVKQQALMASLDSSYVFIQGPPGSGKTFIGARLIVSLIAAGKRIGVAATSHKAINNLLTEVESAAREAGVTFHGLKKCSDDDDRFDGRLIANTFEARECDVSDAALIAGTSWQFSRAEMDSCLDYLFIDEAGQVSLADAVAMGTAARNLVLLGDPQQLPQVRQGIHPGDSGRSVLEHLLGDRATVSEDRGVFLERTWRMHPAVCDFVSRLSYETRLRSAEGRDRQCVSSSGLNGAGLRFLNVEHLGNAQASAEEAKAIAAAVSALLHGGTFTNHENRTRPLTPKDILVVAPYNMQVRCLREELPSGVEVGTVDKFQGREAPVVFFSMASSTGEDVPRGLEFLFSRNRFNVAISRARALAAVVCSPHLLTVPCRTIDQMRLVNVLCRFVDDASADEAVMAGESQ